MSKKFCPSCGNATLLRASVSVTTPTNGSAPTMKVHLKKNFQYRNRGTKYSIPDPQPGTSKTGTGEGLILREDQVEWRRAEQKEQSRKAKETRKITEAIQNAKEGEAAKIGSWMDPDWLPDMLSVGINGKGRSGGGEMPNIGYGRKNPNERRRRR
jgi:RNA-binding protein NOB1